MLQAVVVKVRPIINVNLICLVLGRLLIVIRFPIEFQMLRKQSNSRILI